MSEKVLIVEDQFVEANYLRSMLQKTGYTVCGVASSVEQALEMVKKEKPFLVLLDIFLKGKQTGIDLARILKKDNVAFLYLSANADEEVLTAVKTTQPYGFLVKPFREQDLLVNMEIARYRHRHSLEATLRRELILQEQLKSIQESTDSPEQKLLQIGRALQPYISFDLVTVQAQGVDAICNGFLRTGYDEYQYTDLASLKNITGQSLAQLAKLQAATEIGTAPVIHNGAAFEKMAKLPTLIKLFATKFQVRSLLEIPLQLADGKVFSFCFYSRREDTYNAAHLVLFARLQTMIMQCVQAMLINTAVNAATSLTPLTPAMEVSFAGGFEGIVGASHLLLTVLDHVSQVASLDTSVLIQGESGTGKEGIADRIHFLSPRKDMPMIKVNCAALPPALIESELFGHEKGAFTGASEKRIGKFEQADGGTIFLDEIGEMPLELQVKLLRVLQEREVERIGAKTATKVNIRVIAATNRNLEKEVAEGRFRLDLYYRLNVFPLLLPALRDRKEDIPALVDHFIRYCNRKTGKKVSGITDKCIRSLMNYNWPGNIRELEHFIERSVLLAKGSMLEDLTLPGVATSKTAGEERMKTIHENERDYIIAVLKKCEGRVWGTGAAAEILNIPPSTLKSKMKKLGIKKEYSD